ncbi:Pimeloyl-ACP methyl ester carboxylesterase [Amycolatopsis arida]|uniref:Pimeloyl-ACP methyl ester carboxylesterase n=1 Tax=Amycolatopsis arida TaxID=587909 RepID=A0A1I5WEW5_9PSEU|nr:alpha/beta hydrolase [Amycolatopsis arida]TDX92249.1 pimeloyl-ACP methyl ester carboxylesterase [Amycolatopsis arida]SFQ18284.1 Pimeloyl-ACP methyl ester carboxylesterase [Amycolatopsis arida]
MTEARPGQVASQLTAHHGDRVELPGRYGPVAALRGPRPRRPLATVLLVPGYTGSKEDFAPLLDPCAEAGFRCVAIDLPGQFESPGPDEEEAYLPAPLGAVVAELVERIAGEGPVLLLGHSYGGLVVRGAVLAGARVAGLTLLDSGPHRLPPGYRLTALEAGEPVLRTEGVAAAYAVREAVSAQFPAWATMASELKEFFRDRFVASNPAGLLGMARGLHDEPDRVAELAETLRRGGIPCLVVAGEHDDAWSVPAQRDMAERLGAPFATVAGAAHSPNTENPSGLLKVLLPTWRGWVTGTPDRTG